MRTELFGAFLSYYSSQNTNNFRIFCWFGPQMAMQIEFGAPFFNHIWPRGFLCCSGRVSIYAPNIRCANKLACCKYKKLVWSASPNCKKNHLFILLERAETEIRFSMANGTFKMKMDIDCHGPRSMPNNCKNFNPPNFSLPTTFKDAKKCFLHILFL
jgi:hypothetical protein